MKRVLICLLALLMLAPFAFAAADGNPMRTMKLETEKNGDVLDVRFTAEIAYPTDTAAFEPIDFVLTYSAQALELIELVKDGDAPESEIIDSSFIMLESTEQAGRFEYHGASALGHRGSGLLLHLRFRVIGDGGYSFSVKKDGYSIYDPATNKSESYRFPLLRTDFGQDAQDRTPLPELKRPDQESAEPVAEEKGWFARLMESIFGSSCTGGK